MPSNRRFRFAAQLHASADGPGWSAQARRVEELGYDALFVPDHFEDQLGPIASLTAAAAATERLRIGSLVFDNDYRHPVVLAKEAATIDVLSGGRLELGIGAGWLTTDYEQSGIPHDEPAVRVNRLEEAIAVLKGLFADGTFDLSGDHYRISGLDGLPKPVQRPHPPLLIGGGSPRVLRIAGREADIIGINPSLRSGAVDEATVSDAGNLERLDRKIGWIREGAGNRFDQIELQMLVFGVTVTDDRAAARAQMAQVFGVDDPSTLELPYLWMGSAGEIAEDLRLWRERWGVSYWVVQGMDAVEAAAPIVGELRGT